MTTTEIDRGPSLLAAILAEPEADNLRLIYADWLDDHEQESRAEFIRVQIELANPAWATHDGQSPQECNTCLEVNRRMRRCEKILSVYQPGAKHTNRYN